MNINQTFDMYFSALEKEDMFSAVSHNSAIAQKKNRAAIHRGTVPGPADPEKVFT